MRAQCGTIGVPMLNLVETEVIVPKMTNVQQ